MITNHDIEIAFVRAQNRINEILDNAQANFYMDDLSAMADAMLGQLKGKPEENASNPLANEEI